ncbi:flippase-like domain-containing protein [bacterium]|nr:flippase-like domain-containing protein [bacterium]
MNFLKQTGIVIEKSPDFKRIFRILIWLIPAGVIGHAVFSILKTDRSVLDSMGSLSFGYLILAFFLSMFPWIPDALKVIIWTRFLKNPLSFRDAFQIVISSELGSAISPTAVGGGYVKLGMLVQKGFPAGTAASLMILGSMEIGLFFSIAVPVSIIITKAHQLPIFDQVIWRFLILFQSRTLWLVLAAAVSVALSCIWIKPLRQWLGRFDVMKKCYSGTVRFINDFTLIYRLIIKSGKRRLCVTLLLTAVQWTSRYTVISALMAFLNVPVDPVLFFLFQWVVFSLGILIPTPGGTVGVEAAFYFVYSAFIPGGIMALTTAAWRFLTYYFLLIMDSIVFIFMHLNIPAVITRRLRIGLEFLTKI